MTAPADVPRRAGRAAGLLGAAGLIAAVTLLSRLLGFGRYLAQYYAVGPAAIGDAYNAANLLPNVLFEVAAGGALAGAVVPVLAGRVVRGARREIDEIVAATLGWVLLVLVPLGGLLAALSGPIAGWLPDVDESLVPVVRFFLLVFAVQVPLYGCAVLLYGVLQAHHRFFWPAFAPVLASLVTIAAYLVYGAMAGGELDDPTALPPGALDWLAWGTTAGVAAMVVPLIGPVRRAGVHLRVSLRFPAGVGRQVAALAFSGVGGLIAQQLAAVLIMLTAKSTGPDGTYAVFVYTQAVYLLPYAVLIVPLATSTFPRLSALAHDREPFARLASATTRGVAVAGAVGAAALFAAGPAVAAVFGSLRSVDAITAMGPALAWMAPGLLGYGLLFHVSRTLFALGRGRAAVVGTATGWGVVAVGAVVAGLVLPEGASTVATLKGLGAAISVGMLAGTAVLLIALRRAAGGAALGGLARTAAVLLVVGLPAALLGRVAADGVLAAVGGLAGALAAGVAGVAVVVLGVGVAVWLADRGTVREVVAAERASHGADTPAAPAATGAAFDGAVPASDTPDGDTPGGPGPDTRR
ncbi:MAG: virulence factor MviN [Actinomycetales bacterium]|nr:virulence factor MviN [Actinomycetales bacterium]